MIIIEQLMVVNTYRHRCHHIGVLLLRSTCRNQLDRNEQSESIRRLVSYTKQMQCRLLLYGNPIWNFLIEEI
jgi:hypothetical protein